MAYEARREDDPEKMRNDQNNANNIRNAADVAIASKNPYAMAAGAAVKAADKISGGKASQELGRGLSKANEITPGGKHVQDLSNKLSESGVSDTAGRAASIKSRAGAGGVGETPNQVVHKGGEQSSSLPSSDEKKNLLPAGGEGSVSGTQQASQSNAGVVAGENSGTPKPSSGSGVDSNQAESDEGDAKGNTTLSFLGKKAIQAVIMLTLPMIVFFLAFLVILSAVSGVFGEYEDAFGISDVSGEETGGVEFNPSSIEQNEFYDRVNEIKFEYLEEGKEFDSVRVIAVFHIINNHNTSVDYKKISDSDIREVVDAMFLEDYYDEETFKTNLLESILPRYIPNGTENDYLYIIDEIFTYTSDYYDLIGKNQENAFGSGGVCSTDSGTCNYQLKGYAISGKGNVSERINPSNIYVRLMQCGIAGNKNYGGSFGKSLEGESLVPFEKYILGVSYASMGSNAPAEAFKAQTVAARSYILSRHADKGGWRTLKEESGKWILQVASCELDQIYCDPDKGCSSDSGGQVYSGLEHSGGSFRMEALSKNSPLRSYASSTEGEVLTNSQGYIIYAGYSAQEKKLFDSLAEKGANYKQILLQVYNQGSRQYGASNITKNTCTNSNGDTNCISSSDYAQWKQGSAAWGNIPMGNSGRNIRQIGCLATAIAIQIAKSGVSTKISNFNPGTFVEFLNNNGGFDSSGNFVWRSATKAAPAFQFQEKISVEGMSRAQKLAKIKELTSQKGIYVIAEVKGNTGQHWVAIDSVNGSTINMMDPGSDSTNMWGKYHWANTSTLVYYKAV